MAKSNEYAAPPKERWNGLKDLTPLVVAFLAGSVVPLAVAWVSASYNARIQDSANSVRYVELAISQLRTPPTAETSALRDWSIELLDSQAPVKLTPAAKQQLRSSALMVPLSGSAIGQSNAQGDLSVVPAKGDVP